MKASNRKSREEQERAYSGIERTERVKSKRGRKASRSAGHGRRARSHHIQQVREYSIIRGGSRKEGSMIALVLNAKKPRTCDQSARSGARSGRACCGGFDLGKYDPWARYDGHGSTLEGVLGVRTVMLLECLGAVVAVVMIWGDLYWTISSGALRPYDAMMYGWPWRWKVSIDTESMDSGRERDTNI